MLVQYGQTLYAGYFGQGLKKDPNGSYVSPVAPYIQPDFELGIIVSVGPGITGVKYRLRPYDKEPCCGKKMTVGTRLIFYKTTHSSDGDDVTAKVKKVNQHSNVRWVHWQWQTCDRWDNVLDGFHAVRGFRGSLDSDFEMDTHISIGLNYWTFNGIAKAHFVVEYCDMTQVDAKGFGRIKRIYKQHSPVSVNGGRKASWGGLKPGQSATYQVKINAN